MTRSPHADNRGFSESESDALSSAADLARSYRIVEITLPQADIDSTRHLPKKKHPGTKKEYWAVIAAVTVASLICTCVLAYGSSKLSESADSRQDNNTISVRNYISTWPQPALDSCDALTSNGSARSFLIDLRTSSYLTFSQAKGIDVAWDLAIGQSGRFVHGWFLYTYIIPDVLTRILELLAVPHDVILNLAFSPISLSAIWSSLTALWRGRGRDRWKVAALTILLILVIGFTLGFATVWSAATGYLSPSWPVFKLPDGTYQELISDSVKICFSLDTDRLNSTSEGIIIGPSLRDVAEARRSNGTAPASTQFTDIMSYVMSMQMLSDGIYSTVMYQVEVLRHNHSAPYDPDQSVPFFNFSSMTPHISSPYPERLVGFQLCGHGEPGCFVLATDLPFGVIPVSDNSTSSGSLLDTPQMINSRAWLDTQYYSVSDHLPMTSVVWDLAGWVYPPGTSVAVKPVTLQFRNITSSPLTNSYASSSYNYNSSLFFDGTAYSLPAPPLDVGKKCGSRYASTAASSVHDYQFPACLCYNDEVIPYPFPNTADSQCLQTQGYVWGFSSYVTMYGLIFETIWVFLCWVLWLDARLNSVIVRKGRRNASGDLRNALDISARVNQDLGTGTVACSTHELKKALKDCDLVGHVVEAEPSGDVHIGILEKRMKPCQRRWWNRGGTKRQNQRKDEEHLSENTEYE